MSQANSSHNVAQARSHTINMAQITWTGYRTIVRKEITRILKAIEATGDVKFEVNNSNIIVMKR